MSEQLPSNQMVGDARELDDQRQVLAEELGEWRDAGAPPEAVVDAIEAFVEAKVDHMSNFPPRQRMTDEGSLGMPTGTCPGETRGNLGANSPAQRSSLDAMVTRFLQWRLPDDFDPDCGISFKKLNHPNSWPIGTNLLNADQAKAMLQYVLGATDETTVTPFGICAKCHQPITSFHNINGCPGEKHG